MEKKIEFVISGKLVGLNEYTNANRRNRYAGARMKKDEEDKIKLYISSQLPKVQVKGKVAIKFTWYDNTRRDIDNICFAKKFILDALVSEGVIEGDDKKHVKHLIDTFPDDVDDPRIVVRIYPLEEFEDEQKWIHQIE